jgi:dienelactone hydrolase
VSSVFRRRNVVAFLATLLAVAVLYLMRDPTSRFMERRSRLVAWQASPVDTIDGHLVQTVHLTAASGLEVDLTVKRPPEADAGQPDRRPLLMLLGGHRTGKDAVRLIPDTRGTVVVALAYPFHGDPRLKGPGIVLKVPAIRAALLDTPPALMLALDYLLQQPYVDPTHVESVGVSLGTPFVVIASALDPRVSRVWVIHGSGDWYTPLEHNMRRKIPFPASVPVAGLSTLIVGGPRLAADKWVGRIAPREFVMINARDDERIPRASVEKLYASAREPKSITWVDGQHVRARPEVVRSLVELVLARVLGNQNGHSAGAVRGNGWAGIRPSVGALEGAPVRAVLPQDRPGPGCLLSSRRSAAQQRECRDRPSLGRGRPYARGP